MNKIKSKGKSKKALSKAQKILKRQLEREERGKKSIDNLIKKVQLEKEQLPVKLEQQLQKVKEIFAAKEKNIKDRLLSLGTQSTQYLLNINEIKEDMEENEDNIKSQ